VVSGVNCKCDTAVVVYFIIIVMIYLFTISKGQNRPRGNKTTEAALTVATTKVSKVVRVTKIKHTTNEEVYLLPSVL